MYCSHRYGLYLIVIGKIFTFHGVISVLTSVWVNFVQKLKKNRNTEARKICVHWIFIMMPIGNNYFYMYTWNLVYFHYVDYHTRPSNAKHHTKERNQNIKTVQQTHNMCAQHKYQWHVKKFKYFISIKQLTFLIKCQIQERNNRASVIMWNTIHLMMAN
jgi:hypothetical protein